MKRSVLTKIGRIFADGTLVDRAVEAAARDAVMRHKQAGVHLVGYRDGKVVTVSATTLLRAGAASRRRSRAIRRSPKKERS